MFELNPLGNPDALWQHILMLVVAAILGYIIGYISGKTVITKLEDELHSLDNNLEHCNNQKIILKNSHQQSHNTVKESFAGIPVVVKTDKHDDLKVIEGIGPKLEILLNNAGIYSFEQLSQKTPEQISAILENSDSRFQIHDPSTWPRQAELAAKGNWDELKAWQDLLTGGREE